MANRIQTRRGTTVAWTAANPVLADGEQAWDSTEKKFKVGDGVTAWSDLPYQSSGGGGAVDSVNGKTGTVVLKGSDIIVSATDGDPIDVALGKKQNTLTEGTAIDIDGNEIRVKVDGTTIATNSEGNLSVIGGGGGSYSAGNGINIASNQISAKVDGTTIQFDSSGNLKAVGGGSGAVDSVNGKTGTVVLTGADINVSGSDTTKIGTQVTTNKNDIAGIKNGTTINTFGAVETALGNKVDKEANKSLVSDTDITQITTNKTAIGTLASLVTTAKDNLVNAINEVKNALANYILKTDIVDNLTSTDTDKPLSAKQGKELQDTKQADILTGITGIGGQVLARNSANDALEFVSTATAGIIYDIGQVYETTDTTMTIETLATKFGGTWEAIADRKEWNEDTYSQTTGSVTPTVFRAHLSSNGIVNITIGGNADNSRITELYLPRKYRQNNVYGSPVGETIWIGSMNAGAGNGAIGFPTYENATEAVYLQTYQTIENACFNGSWDTGAPADRTFKRFKRLS